MKLNLPLLKLVTRLLVLLILFVILFLLSSIMYSAKYWPDVYNYINANVTIKRIPTLKELNLTIISVPYYEDITETFSTTDGDYSDSTTDIFDYTDTFEDFFLDRKKRDVQIEETSKDYSELSKNVVVHYVFAYDEASTMRDSVDEGNLSTRSSDEVEMIAETGNERGFQEMSKPRCVNQTADLEDVLFPWIATIFRKNGTNNQFDYTCDGALLSENVILTAARCVIMSNATADTGDFIIVLGKKSLQTTGGYEKVHKIKQITLHENFTQDGVKADNDLAILVLEEETTLNDGVTPACMDGESGEIEEAATTGWGVAGKLTPILFDAKTSKNCEKNTRADNIFCATYGNDVTFCPSYGGLYVAKYNSSWSLQGIRTGDTTHRAFCLDRTVVFTSLNNYSEWIAYHIDLNKVL